MLTTANWNHLAPIAIIDCVRIVVIGYCLIWFRNTFILKKEDVTTPDRNSFNTLISRQIRYGLIWSIGIRSSWFLARSMFSTSSKLNMKVLNNQNNPGKNWKMIKIGLFSPYNGHGVERILFLFFFFFNTTNPNAALKCGLDLVVLNFAQIQGQQILLSSSSKLLRLIFIWCKSFHELKYIRAGPPI